jgi:uncharacterized protein (DUF1330 family)
MKIRAVGAEFFHADGQADRRIGRRTDMRKLIVAFRNFANAPKIHDASYYAIACSLQTTGSVNFVIWEVGRQKTN